MFNEFEETPAYAKLQGKEILKFINKLNVFIGRETSITDHKADEDVIYISDSNKISRRHVQIYWDEINGNWFLKNLSKNQIYVDKILVKNSSGPVKLSPMSSIKIDDCKFYFFQAREEDNQEIV